MPFYSLILVALAMSTDAFAAAIGKGARMHRPTVTQAVKTGALFGTIEAITPMLGWLMGRAAVNWASQWDHWIAFTLLMGLGLHMLYEGVQPPEEETTPTNPSRWRLATTALATSIDALAVGVGLAFVEVNILVAAGLIGLATFSMVTLGIMIGRAAGALLGKRAEILGGVILMAVGGHILYDHLSRGI